MVVTILLYADEIVLIVDSAEGLQKYLVAHQSFCECDSMKVEKTKIIIFNILH